MLSRFHCVVATVAVLAALTLGCSGGNQPSAQDKDGKKDGADKKAVDKKELASLGPPEFTFTAEEFSREFIEPKTASSDTKFRNKIVAVTGEVSHVRSKDGGKGAEVFLKGDK